MSDIELQALAMLMLAEVSAMNAENSERMAHNLQMAYVDSNYLTLDCVRCLDVELRRRKVLITTEESDSAPGELADMITRGEAKG